jgi:1,2-dihydroxy-3-keto-5-methylthiopentene dioxygenase
VSLLVTWRDDNPHEAVRQTNDPEEIAAAMTALDCRFERRPVADVPPDAGQDAYLEAYREVIDKLVTDEKFVTVDVATIHPSPDPDWPESAAALRAKFIDEHTHGDDDEMRFMVRGGGVFFLHIGDQVHALHAEAGDLSAVPKGTTHWFDTGAVPDFTAVRFFHEAQGWIGIPTGSDIATRFPDGDAIRALARELGRD